MAEMGLRMEEMGDLDKFGGAAQNLEGEKVRCMPGGDGKPVEAKEAVEAEEAVTYSGVTAEKGLSLEIEEEGRSPGKAGGAAQTLEGVKVMCMPGGDGTHCVSGLSLGIGGEKRIPRVAKASDGKTDEVNTQIVKTINKNQSVSDHKKRSANLSGSLKECEKKI